MLNRRTYLKFAASASALAAVSSARWQAWGLPPDDAYLSKIGLQLYTLRNQMAADPVSTLKAVAAAGYKQVELMDAMDAPKLVPIAKDAGLSCTSAFLTWQILGEAKPSAVHPSLDTVIETAKKFDIKYLVFGYVGKGNRETLDQYKAMTERSNAAGEKIKAAGMQLCYHHHSFEFEPLFGGKSGMDVFIEKFDKELCKFEIDVFWAAIGGYDPVGLLERLGSRVVQVHLKDLMPNTGLVFDEGKVPKEAFKEVGAGNIDMKKVIEVSKKIGVVQCHVEQDQSPDPLQSIQLSINNLKTV